MTNVKTLDVAIKADASTDSGLAEGQFTGYAAVFGNKDSYGDVILKGAFAESLAESYGEGGAGVPCYWSHRMDDPDMNVGSTIECREDDHGLFVKVQLDLDTQKGAQVHRLIKAGRVRQMSFAYEVQDWAEGKSDEHGWYQELRKLKLFEVSVVPVGANQSTELLDVKTRIAHVKAGRTISADNEDRLKQAAELIDAVLSSIDPTTEESDDESPSGEEPESAKSEEPETAKGEEQAEAKARTGNPESALAHLKILEIEGSL